MSEVVEHVAFGTEISDQLLDRVVDFLLGLSDPRIDPLWSRDSLRWKLGQTHRGVLAWATNEDDVVATVSVAPRRVWYEGEVLSGGELGDGYTRRDFQGQGLFSRLARKALDEALRSGTAVVYATPNDNSKGPLERRVGFHAHPLGIWSFERALSPAPDDQPGTPARLRQGSAFSMSNEMPREAEIEDLWQRVRRQFRAFALVHDAQHFRSRFIQNPLASYVPVAAYRRRTLVGLLLFRHCTVITSRRDVVLADWLYDWREGELFDAMVDFVVGEAVRGSADILSAWCPALGREAAALASDGFAHAWDVPLLFSDTAKGIELQQAAGTLDFPVGASDNV